MLCNWKKDSSREFQTNTDRWLAITVLQRETANSERIRSNLASESVQLSLEQMEVGLNHKDLSGPENVGHPVPDGDGQIPAFSQSKNQFECCHGFVAHLDGSQDEGAVGLIVGVDVRVEGGRFSGGWAAGAVGHDRALSAGGGRRGWGRDWGCAAAAGAGAFEDESEVCAADSVRLVLAHVKQLVDDRRKHFRQTQHRRLRTKVAPEQRRNLFGQVVREEFLQPEMALFFVDGAAVVVRLMVISMMAFSRRRRRRRRWQLIVVIVRNIKGHRRLTTRRSGGGVSPAHVGSGGGGLFSRMKAVRLHGLYRTDRRRPLGAVSQTVGVTCLVDRARKAAIVVEVIKVPCSLHGSTAPSAPT